MARRVLAVVACVSSAQRSSRRCTAPRAPRGEDAARRDAPRSRRKEALPSSVVLDEEEERRLKKERRLAAAETSLGRVVVGLSHHNKVEVASLAIPQDERSERKRSWTTRTAPSPKLRYCPRAQPVRSVFLGARRAAAFASISQHFQGARDCP